MALEKHRRQSTLEAFPVHEGFAIYNWIRRINAEIRTWPTPSTKATWVGRCSEAPPNGNVGKNTPAFHHTATSPQLWQAQAAEGPCPDRPVENRATRMENTRKPTGRSLQSAVLRTFCLMRTDAYKIWIHHMLERHVIRQFQAPPRLLEGPGQRPTAKWWRAVFQPHFDLPFSSCQTSRSQSVGRNWLKFYFWLVVLRCSKPLFGLFNNPPS